MEKIPSSQQLKDYYTSYSYAIEEVLPASTIKSYNILLDEFEKYKKTNKILDVGCGRGWFLLEAKKRGWRVYGTEYSQTAVKRCRENGIEMKEGELDLALFDEKDFDIITSFEVIEHINNPHKELKLIYDLLRIGGLFYCTTPNFNSLMRYYLKDKYNIIEYPEHLSYYTKSTLNKVVNENGLKPIKFLSTGISISRIQASKKIPSKADSSNQSSDEILRTKINEKWYLKFAKKLINSFFTITNLGLTLKGYYIKK
ncbi:MAG: class I SAM-dependent methyltransferase [Bacteroidota bacterium]|nr:class I SAM-dependent methyltransferase [Bacteroidota bacterium]